MGKTSSAVKNRYNAKAYDRINLLVPKGHKADIVAHADSVGMSVNAFINSLIDSVVSHNSNNSPSDSV